MKKNIISAAAGIVLASVVLAAAGTVCWNYIWNKPFPVKIDCRGRGVDVETMKRWEKQEDKENLGVVGMAGWRVGEQQSVCSVSTGRKQPAQVILVYGSMELAAPAPVLNGRCGMDVEGNFCVLSQGLAVHLFGSVDVAGECVKTEKELFLVSGVIRGEEDILMIPMGNGKVEELVVVFNRRLGAEDNMRRFAERFAEQ